MTNDTHRTIDHLYSEVDTLRFQLYHCVLAPRWFYLPFGKRHTDVIQPEVTLDCFVDGVEEVDARDLNPWVEKREVL